MPYTLISKAIFPENSMTGQTSRRSFLGLSALGLAAAAAPADILASEIDHPPQGPRDGSEISVWVTSGDDRFAVAPNSTWHPALEKSGNQQIHLNPATKFQEILGFGGAFTDAACYTFNRLASDVRERLFHELFHPSEMGLSVGRICVGSSDYSTSLYSFDEGEPDPELKRFSIDHDRQYILPILLQARKANPGLFLFSTPWSPPGWMKANGSMLGGSMRKPSFAVYAEYYLRFLQAYAAEGVPVQALTTQNEPDTDQDGRMPACLWGQEYEIEFLRDHLGPLIERNSLPTKIWILDHNYNLWGRVVCSLEDEKLRNYANAVAWHGYSGTPDMMSRVQEAFPEIEMHWTEGGPDYKDPAYLTDWCKWAGTFCGVLRNWCCSITSWNLALDENGKPNIGPFPCGGVVTIHSQTKEVTRSGQFWAFAHFSRLLRRGARRFASYSSAPDLHHVALENPDGQRVLVTVNEGPARKIELDLANMTASISLKAGSVTTLAWK
jgi:glucosylceramidase